MSARAHSPLQDLLAVELPAGTTLVPRPTPLTRLHYYDGKFLRASDLELEQRYLRQLVAFANQAGGAGVVHGYDAVWPGGDRLELGPGLALDPQGRTLLLTEPATLSLTELIAASRGAGALALTTAGPRRVGRPVFSDCEPLAADDGDVFVDGGALWAVTLFHAEALCGTEDVLGRLCAEACATSTERPYILEGVIVRAVPLRLETPLATSAAVALTGRHLRSLAASAWFADEWRRGGSLISAAGLASDAWCLGAAAQGGAGVPIGLVARAGESTLFFDAWTLRRERIEPPPRRYWAGRMAMRPWDVFLAQVLQFQCQLAHCLGHGAPEDDPCRPAIDLLRQSSEELARWLAAAPADGSAGGPTSGFARSGALASNPALAGVAGVDLVSLEQLRGRLADAAATLTAAPAVRFLLGCGITELPAAGYLPVVPGSTLTVNEQVRRMMGEGVDLRFCVVRPDFVAHALEEAQHMERISLLAGLDDPAKKPQVDVLVPDGALDTRAVTAPGQGYEIELGLTTNLVRFFEGLVSGEGVGGVAVPVGGLAGADFSAASGARSKTAAAVTVNRPAAIVLPDDSLRFVGAGRGEDLAAGGLAFHLAGRERSSSFGRIDRPGNVDIIVDPVRGLPSAAVWLTASIDRDPFTLGLHDRAGVGAEIVLTHVTTGGEGNLETRTLELDFHGEIGVVDRSSAPAGGPRLTAQAVGRLTVTGRGDGGAPVARSLRVQEEVRFERTSGAAGGDVVTVSLPHFRLFRQDVRTELVILVRRERPEASLARVEGTAALAGADATTVALRERQVAALTAQLVATGVPAAEARRRAEVQVPAVVSRAAAPIFLLDQRENDDVVRADHPAHEAAITALQRLGQALAEPGFADPRARRLFPPPAPAATDLVVRATRDWVLFHRRRTKVCVAEAAPVQVTARRYRLYQVPLRSRDEREVLRRLLAEGGGLANFNPKAVGTVEFAGGLASVETAAPIVRAAWDGIAPDGAEIVLGAVASQGAAVADGTTLAGARLDALAGVLAPVTPRAADAPFEVLADLPPDLPAVGLDGAVVYATLAPAVETVCHSALLLRDTTFSFVTEVANRIAVAGFDPGLFANTGPVELGNVGFSAGTTEAVEVDLETLKSRLGSALPGGIPRGLSLAALTVSAAGTPAADHAVHRAQGEAMVRALGGLRVVRDVTAGGTAPLPSGCPAITVLFLAKTAELPAGSGPGPANPQLAAAGGGPAARATRLKKARRTKKP